MSYAVEVTRSREIEPRLRGLSAGPRRPTSAEGSRRTYEYRPGSYRDDKAVENSAPRRAGPNTSFCDMGLKRAITVFTPMFTPMPTLYALLHSHFLSTQANNLHSR